MTQTANTSNLLYRRLIGTVFFLYILVIFHIRIFNQGGFGLMLPGNSVAWMFAAIIVLIYWWRDPTSKETLQLSSNSYLFLAAALLLLLPLAYTDSRFISNTIFQWLAVAGGVIFFITIRQYAMNNREKNILFYGIIFAISFELFFSLLRMLMAPHDAPSGEVLQQVNVFASFVSTGIGMTLYCVLTPTRLAKTDNLTRYLLLNLFLFIAVAVLVNLYSLIGYITGLLVIVTFLLSYLKRFQRQDYFTYAVIMLALAAGILWSYYQGGSLLEKQQSSHERLIVWQNTWQLIKAHPLTGTGYGSFEYAFQHFMIRDGRFNSLPELFTHPHNEILYWWAEGGLLAILGFALLIIGYVRLFCRAFAHDFLQKDQQPKTAVWGLAILLLPITLHNFVEYPFYIAATHWLLFITLLAILDGSVPQKIYSNRSLLTPIRYFAFIGAIATLIFMATALKALINLTSVEVNQFKDCTPISQTWNKWALWTRTQYDLQTCNLIQYKQDNNAQRLVSYRAWAEHYLQVHIDKGTYHNLIIIERMLGDEAKSKQLEREGARLLYSYPGVHVKISSSAAQKMASEARAQTKP